MADFSEYTGPSADWIALEPTLPKLPDVGPEELKQIVNTTREELAAQGMASGQSFRYSRRVIGKLRWPVDTSRPQLSHPN